MYWKESVVWTGFLERFSMYRIYWKRSSGGPSIRSAITDSQMNSVDGPNLTICFRQETLANHSAQWCHVTKERARALSAAPIYVLHGTIAYFVKCYIIEIATSDFLYAPRYEELWLLPTEWNRYLINGLRNNCEYPLPHYKSPKSYYKSQKYP